MQNTEIDEILYDKLRANIALWAIYFAIYNYHNTQLIRFQLIFQDPNI